MIGEVDAAESHRVATPDAEKSPGASTSTSRRHLPTRAKATRTRRLLSHTRILLLALGGVFLVGMFLSPTFLSLANLRNIMLNVSILGMLALGMTVVMLLREIDLSVGSLMAFAPIAAITLTDRAFSSSDKPVIVAGNIVVSGTAFIVVLTLVIGALVGVVNGLLTVRGLVPSVIVTLGTLFALRGASYEVSGGNQYYLTDLPGFMWLGTAVAFDFIPVSFLMFLAIGSLSFVSLRYTKAGRRIYSIGGNERAAVYSGVRTGRFKIMAFVFSGLCAGGAALIFCSRLGSAEAGQATGFELSAIAICVVGGTTLEGGRGTVVNAMLSSVLLAFVMNIIALRGLVVWYQTIIIGLIIITAGFTYTVKDRSRAIS